MGQTALRSAIPVEFASGETESKVVDLSGNKVAALYIPNDPAFASTTGITFLASPSPNPGVSFFPIFDDLGVQYSAVVAPSRVTALDGNAMALAGPRYVKLVLNAAAAADGTIYVLTTN